MENPLSFYQAEVKKHKETLVSVKAQLLTSSMIRLVIFLLATFAIYFFFDTIKILIGIVVLAGILFLFLVSRHTDLQYKRDKLKKLIAINEVEIQVFHRKFK